MLPDHCWNCAGWQVLQVSGSIRSAFDSVVGDPDPHPARAPSVTKATARPFIPIEVCSHPFRVSEIAFRGHSALGVSLIQPEPSARDLDESGVVPSGFVVPGRDRAKAREVVEKASRWRALAIEAPDGPMF